ncbi:unnamed protein product, partial [Medioppia subpectinata]
GLFLADYPHCEPFTKVYLIKYKFFANAVRAKKSLDDRNFLGSILHVCYAPELESIDETRDKLEQRRRYVSYVLNEGQSKTPLNTSGSTGSVPIVNQTDAVVSNESKSIPVYDKNNETSKRKYSEIKSSSCDESHKTESISEPKKPKLKETPKIRWRK